MNLRVFTAIAIVMVVVLCFAATTKFRTDETRSLEIEDYQQTKLASDSEENDSRYVDEDTVEEEELLRDGRIECAKIQMTKMSDFDLCMRDILMTKDVGLAGLWPQQQEDTLTDEAKMLRKARINCAAVPKDSQSSSESGNPKSNFERCVEDVVLSRNEQASHKWIQTGVKRKLRGNLETFG